MKITNFKVLNEDIEPDQISTNSLVVKKSLNPDIWSDDIINEEIRDQALAIGEDFFEFCTKDFGSKVELKDIKKKINKMRDAALAKDGEFSIDNLVFKLLRRSGYIEKLKKNIEKYSSKPQ